jgi:ATP-dependent Zn protease
MPESTSCVTIVHIEATAYHEAGRVFMAIYLGARVRSVTIDGFVAE